jgi:hypothetical protein
LSEVDLSSKVPVPIQKAKEADFQSAKGWAQDTWAPIAQQRYEAAARGESSPWLGVKQWATEIPLNMNMRGAGLEDNIALREQKFQAEMQRLQKLAEQNKSGKILQTETPWTGVR